MITRSPFESQALAACLRFVGERDVLLLINDGVYALSHPLLQRTPCQVYYLSSDAEARGIVGCGSAKASSYAGMVELTEQHNPIHTWS